MPEAASFDITTGCDAQEVDNAVHQTQKELRQRYDFKAVVCTVELKRSENLLVLSAPDTFKLKAMLEVLHSKLVRRGVPIKNLQEGPIQPAAGSTVRQEITLQQGIDEEAAKRIVKFIKTQKLKKTHACIQHDQVRVTSPSRDELQQVIKLLKEQDFGMELQFGNYR